MSRIGTKICGLSTPATIGAAVQHGARYIGFMFFAKSPRNVTFEQAAALAAPVPGHVGRIGVFVDPEDAQIEQAVRLGRLDGVQLHGKESPERVAALKQRLGLEVWKVVPVRTRADLEGARAYRGAADYILYDAKPPEGAALPGGIGLRFDWRLLDGHDHPLPWGLAGGLDADNVGEAVGISGARLVDVSSGVESAPGVKDVDKIARFLQAVASL